jgi:hypothetical protein
MVPVDLTFGQVTQVPATTETGLFCGISGRRIAMRFASNVSLHQVSPATEGTLNADFTNPNSGRFSCPIGERH